MDSGLTAGLADAFKNAKSAASAARHVVMDISTLQRIGVMLRTHVQLVSLLPALTANQVGQLDMAFGIISQGLDEMCDLPSDYVPNRAMLRLRWHVCLAHVQLCLIISSSQGGVRQGVHWHKL